LSEIFVFDALDLYEDVCTKSLTLAEERFLARKEFYEMNMEDLAAVYHYKMSLIRSKNARLRQKIVILLPTDYVVLPQLDDVSSINAVYNDFSYFIGSHFKPETLINSDLISITNNFTDAVMVQIFKAAVGPQLSI
jgi:hypothetical protein